MNPRLLLPLLATVALTTGCPSVSNLTSARTLDKGTMQVTVAPVVLSGVAAPTSDEDEGEAGLVGVPSVEGQFRYGITDHLEVGAKLWLGGFAGHLKVGILRSDSESGFNLSVDPGVSYSGFSAGDTRLDFLYVYLPVLAGIRFSGHELTFGPRLVPVFAGIASGDSSGRGFGVLAGGSVALSFRIGQAFRLTPELSMLVPLDGQDTNSAIVQAGLGFSFGGN